VTDHPHTNHFYHGDAARVACRFAPNSVQMVVTSPPYYQQRNYEAKGQIGQEQTPEEYIERLVKVFAAVRKSLCDDGTVWIVLGDKYVKKQLLGMPWRVALALQADGWFLRSDIIWHKPNAMPSSVKQRPTTDHEYLFMLSKSTDYYYDADAIREPHVTFTEKSQMKGGRNHFFKRGSTPEAGKNQGDSNLHNGRWDQAFHPKGRNKRPVWSIPLSKFREAHFAVFPDPLVAPCILAGSPPDTSVLDPFMGAGTTAVVARRLGRRFVGIDVNREYCEMAKRRLASVETPLFPK